MSSYQGWWERIIKRGEGIKTNEETQHMKYFKRSFLVILSVIAFLLIWYATNRLSSDSVAVKTYKVQPMSILPAGDNAYLKVGGFNIAHARGSKYGATNWQNQSIEAQQEQLDLIAQQLREEGSDVIVLNEIDFRARWSLDINQAEYIAKKAGYQYVAEQRNIDISVPFYDFKFGNAILSKHKISDCEHVKYPRHSRWEGYLAGNHDGLLCVINAPSNQVAVLAVHLEHRSETARMDSARQINKLSKEYNFPFLAIGDFNSTPIEFYGSKVTNAGKNTLTYLLNEAGFRNAAGIVNSVAHYTFPSENPDRVIDWILAKGNARFINSEIVKSNISDHFMIVSVLEI